MKVLAFFLCIVILASCTNESKNKEEKTKTEASYMEEDTSSLFTRIGLEDAKVDLGKLVSFNNSQEIRFTNNSHSRLIINEVYTESDRVKVYGFTFEIEPGEQGTIRLKIDQNLNQEAFSDYLFIRTNDEQSLARLRIDYELSDSLVVGGFYVEDNDRINVRMFPSLDATVLFGLNKGDEITCIGAMKKDYVEAFDSDLWYYVDYNGRKGWILSALTDFKTTEIVAMK